ncbi:hypothetical protein SDC9_100241 [bioreactor metagenome]|uniref:Uncharacterized protein n=1 Tax=bioreactor metagenome TaxID=1076179 RepID=A0A645ARI3_9ZZZZ
MEGKPYAAQSVGARELCKVDFNILPCTTGSNHTVDYCPGSTGVGTDFNKTHLAVCSVKIACEVQPEGRKCSPVHFGSDQVIAASVAVLSVVVAHGILGVRRNCE